MLHYKRILLCFSFGFFVSTVQAQPISLTRYLSDTTSLVKQELARLASKPFNPQPDTIIQKLSALLTYQSWSKNQTYDYFTPVNELADMFAHRAQSEWMLGMFKFSVLPYFISMESGLLPVLESSKTHLDSTQYYYGKVNRYQVGQSLTINRIDSTFAAILYKRLSTILNQIKTQPNVNSLMDFSPLKEAELAYDSVKVSFDSLSINQSLTKWLYSGLQKQKEAEPTTSPLIKEND